MVRFFISFFLILTLACQNQQKHTSSLNPVTEKTDSHSLNGSSKKLFATSFTESKDLQSLLTEQMSVETQIEAKAALLYDILVDEKGLLASCPDFDLKTVMQMDYENLKQILLDMGKLRFSEEIKTMNVDEIAKWYQSRIVSGDLVEEISKKNEFQSNHNQLIVILEIPTIIIGSLGAYYTMRDIRKWSEYLKKERTIKIEKDGAQKEIELVRHTSGFLVEPDDLKKETKDIFFYLDDPVTKKLIMDGAGYKKFGSNDLERLGIKYTKWKGLRDTSGKTPIFVRDEKGLIDASFKLDPTIYDMANADDAAKNLRKVDVSPDLLRTALTKAKKNRSKFDPSSASGIEKHFGTSGRWVLFFTSLAAATAGLIVTTDTFLGLDQNQTPTCSAFEQFKKLTLEISQLKSHYMDIKTQVLLLL